jgi:hypothetical protein
MDRFDDLDSSVNAEALKVGDYQVPPVYAAPLPFAMQHAEQSGKATDYPHELHRSLMETVVPLRTTFR